MRATGEVRKIDEFGRVVIPKIVRTDLDLKKEDPVEILTKNDEIVIQRYYPACTFCGTKEEDEINRYKFSGKTVCRSCAESVTGGSFE